MTDADDIVRASRCLCSVCAIADEVAETCGKRYRTLNRAARDDIGAWRAMRLWLSDVEYAALSRYALEHATTGTYAQRVDIHRPTHGLPVSDVMAAGHYVPLLLEFMGVRVLCPTVHDALSRVGAPA